MEISTIVDIEDAFGVQKSLYIKNRCTFLYSEISFRIIEQVYKAVAEHAMLYRLWCDRYKIMGGREHTLQLVFEITLYIHMGKGPSIIVL